MSVVDDFVIGSTSFCECRENITEPQIEMFDQDFKMQLETGHLNKLNIHFK